MSPAYEETCRTLANLIASSHKSSGRRAGSILCSRMPASRRMPPSEHYDSIFDINVKGLLFTVQKALPLMPDGASIILNASIVASKGFSSNSVYSATKAAVRSFARTWTTDLKDRRIRVNAVSPGPIDTPGLNDLAASTGAGEQRLRMLSNSVPLGRLGRPDEIAKAVVFLASDDSSYVTGTELFVDGGIAQV